MKEKILSMKCWFTTSKILTQWCHPHQSVEIFELWNCIPVSLRNRNRVQKYYGLFIRGPDEFESWTNRVTKTRDTIPETTCDGENFFKEILEGDINFDRYRVTVFTYLYTGSSVWRLPLLQHKKLSTKMSTSLDIYKTWFFNSLFTLFCFLI